MKIPGPDHTITIAPQPKRARAYFQGRLIADSTEALTLTEASYGPVTYFPRADVVMEALSRTDHHTHCPYKGEASYYSLIGEGGGATNAVWTYEDPFPAVARIKDALAFYPNHVRVEIEA